MSDKLKKGLNDPQIIESRNSHVTNAFDKILILVENYQTWMWDEMLRTRIIRNMPKTYHGAHLIIECRTPWCMISLNQNESGLYYINYSLDYRAQNMIGQKTASVFICRIREITSCHLENHDWQELLDDDCLSIFQSQLNELPHSDNQKVIIQNKHRFFGLM